jgi:hypothetical protein
MLMKQILSLLLVILLLMGGLGVHVEPDVLGCTASEAAYFEAYLYPLFEDYTALREAFVAAGVSVLVILLVVAVPQLESLQDRLVHIVVSVILALLGAPALI